MGCKICIYAKSAPGSKFDHVNAMCAYIHICKLYTQCKFAPSHSWCKCVNLLLAYFSACERGYIHTHKATDILAMFILGRELENAGANSLPKIGNAVPCQGILCCKNKWRVVSSLSINAQVFPFGSRCSPVVCRLGSLTRCDHKF
jgi:hypothetical protein